MESMSWRDNLRSTSDRVQIDSRIYSSPQDTFDNPFAEIMPLLNQIGDRDVVVDACLPPQLANDLRRNNLNAIWVPAILGDGASDGEIERQLLSSKWDQQWGGGEREKVLLTRDVQFYKKVRGKAILISYKASNSVVRRSQSTNSIRKEIKRIIREENSRS